MGISNEEQLRQQLMEKNRQLEQALEAARRAEEDARRSAELAERANRSKTRFLAQTSHELRTPLNIIIGMTGLAMDELENKRKVREYLTKIDSSSKILLSLLNDILDMSAIEGGELSLDRKKFDFKSLLSNLSVMTYQEARKKNIHFDVHLKGVTEDWLIGDELRLNQVLMNILENARKFTPSGGSISLTVVQASTSRERVHLRFLVSDTGCGISEEMQSRLFQPFEQESADSAQKHGGSGLGLAITKSLVEKMGGFISVTSQLGKGSEFQVDIPFERVGESQKTQVCEMFSDCRALIVADSVQNCRERGAVLEDMGLTYDFVTDKEQALDMIGQAEEEGNPYKLCVIDWRLRDHGGQDLVEEIRDIFGEEMVIIGASFDVGDSVNEGLRAGANYMVCKPVFRSTLFDALMHISEGKLDPYSNDRLSEQYDFGGRRVLVAEDIALNMEVAVKLLKKVNLSVLCAEDGQEAVDIFENNPEGFFDCVLLDINMPVMDGYEAARRIRASKRAYGAKVPMYAMTANAFTSDVAEALNAGMDGHIAKPIETDVLYRTLKEAFAAETPAGGEAGEEA